MQDPWNWLGERWKETGACPSAAASPVHVPFGKGNRNKVSSMQP